jgi:2'-5' RNA ligase
MIKFKQLILFFLVYLGFLSSFDAAAKEYGIALLLPKKYSSQAKEMNQKIAAQTSATNLPNVFHITLFQGNFSQKNVKKIYFELKKQNFRKIKITLESEITSAEQRFINWQVAKNEELQNLHKKIVQVAAPYHDGILARYSNAYDLSENQRQQLEMFGMSGVLENYNPHVTLFYSQKNPEIAEIAKDFWLLKDESFEASSLAIVELGYSGNVEKIFRLIDLN